MRVLVFGASITQGFWDTQGGWVQRLRTHYDELKVENIKNEDNYPDFFNLGISCDTAKDVLARFNNEANARITKGNNSSVIIFSAGTNSAAIDGDGKEWSKPEEYSGEIKDLVAQAKEFTNRIIFVGIPPCDESRTTPVFWRDIHYTNGRIALFDKVVRDICSVEQIPYVATIESFEEQINNGKNLFADGLHPNNEGHKLIFELARPELDKLLHKS
jgi:acyl-CoA thioesterase-1